jgi:hypothetical protein
LACGAAGAPNVKCDIGSGDVHVATGGGVTRGFQFGNDLLIRIVAGRIAFLKFEKDGGSEEKAEKWGFIPLPPIPLPVSFVKAEVRVGYLR